MPKKNTLKRREFLTPMVVGGTGALLGGVSEPVQAMARALTESAPTGGKGNAKAKLEDFSSLVGQRLTLKLEDGSQVQARLIEATPTTTKGRKGKRVRQDPFSIVLDVPEEVELNQGHYGLWHGELGSLELFMVPVDLPTRFNRLETIFG